MNSGDTTEDQAQINLMLYRAANREAKAHIQFDDQAQKEPTRLLESEDHGKTIILAPPRGFLASAHLEKPARILVYLDGQVILGFKSILKKVSELGLHFDAPPKIVKIQRRQSVRWAIPKGYEIFLELDSVEDGARRTQRRLVDISETGLAFHVLSGREARLWRPGLICKNLKFTLENHFIRADGQIANHNDMPPASGFTGTKIGIKFLRIAKEDVEFIQTYVADKVAHLLF